MEVLERKVELISIGKLVSRYGVAAESLRNWERAGLIPPAHRTPGGHRRFGSDHVQALDRLLGYRVDRAAEDRPSPWRQRPDDDEF